MASKEKNDYLLALGVPADLVAKLNAATKPAISNQDARRPSAAASMSTMAASTTAYQPAIDDDDDDDDVQPTPMALPEPGKPVPPVKPIQPKKTTVISFDKAEEAKDKNIGVVRGDGRALKDEVMAAMRHLGDRALIRADEFTLEIVNAGLDFQAYAKPKIKELEKAKERASELTGALVNGVLGLVAGELTAKISNEIGKKIAEKIADGLKEQLVSKVKSIGKDSDDLEGAVDKIAQGFRFYASAVHKSVEENIGRFASDAEAGARSGKLSDAQWQAIEPFLNIDDSTLDDMLERKFGIPGAGRGKELHVKIFREMVKKFEQIHLRAAGAIAHDDEAMAHALIDAIGVADRAAGKLSDDMHKAEMRGTKRR
jgi:hypothetical protein